MSKRITRERTFFGLIRKSSISCRGWRTSGEQIWPWWDYCIHCSIIRDSSLSTPIIAQYYRKSLRAKQLRERENVLGWKSIVICDACMFPQHCVQSQGLHWWNVPICITLCCLYIPVLKCHQARLNMAVSLPHFIPFFLPSQGHHTFPDIAYCATHFLLPFLWIQPQVNGYVFAVSEHSLDVTVSVISLPLAFRRCRLATFNWQIKIRLSNVLMCSSFSALHCRWASTVAIHHLPPSRSSSSSRNVLFLSYSCSRLSIVPSDYSRQSLSILTACLSHILHYLASVCRNGPVQRRIVSVSDKRIQHLKILKSPMPDKKEWIHYMSTTHKINNSYKEIKITYCTVAQEIKCKSNLQWNFFFNLTFEANGKSLNL